LAGGLPQPSDFPLPLKSFSLLCSPVTGTYCCRCFLRFLFIVACEQSVAPADLDCLPIGYSSNVKLSPTSFSGWLFSFPYLKVSIFVLISM
jgi:hypothetical protein